MMNKEERIEKSKFNYELVNLLTEKNNDEDFYKRLLWALERISLELTRFTES